MGCGCSSDEEPKASPADEPLVADRGPGTFTHPVQTERLMRYWSSGKGAAKIGWGRPCDFCACLRQLRKYVKNPRYLRGLCANLHKRVLGKWPAEHDLDKKNRNCPC